MLHKDKSDFPIPRQSLMITTVAGMYISQDNSIRRQLMHLTQLRGVPMFAGLNCSRRDIADDDMISRLLPGCPRE